MYLQIGGTRVVLFDWGLAAQAGSPLHTHRGSVQFYHNEIVLDNGPLLCNKKYDIASTKYCALAVHHYRAGTAFAVPFPEDVPQIQIEERERALRSANYHNYQEAYDYEQEL